MIRFERGRAAHTTFIEPQQGQEFDRAFLLGRDAWIAVERSVAISGWADGRCVGIAGLIDQPDGSALVWALLSKYAGPYMLPVTRKVRRVIEAYPRTNIEATCVASYPERERWLEVLGFVKYDSGVYSEAYQRDVDLYRFERAA